MNRPSNRRFGPPPARAQADAGTASLEGVLLVDKPADWTSHDVVAKLRNYFHVEKVGHGGTLDPMATGLLVILLGRGTKLSDQIMGSDKTYEGVMRLGSSTSSHDREGDVLAEHDCSGITRAQLETGMLSFVGDIRQTPPMVSAVKKNGVPLYKLARKGQTIERESRPVHVYEFRLLDFNLPTAAFRLQCTKGTYVRTICHDLGQQLGCHAHLADLRRTQSGVFDLTNALTLDQLLALSPDEVRARVITLADYQQMIRDRA